MSGGVAYVLDENNDLYRKVNKSLVSTEELSNKYDVLELKAMIEDHVKYTNSIRGKEILNDFEEYLPKFKKIIPYDYKKMLNAIAKMEEKADRMLDQANAMAELNAEKEDDIDSLAAKYDDDGAGSAVDDELAALKAKMGL